MSRLNTPESASLLSDAERRALRYLAGLDARRVAPGTDAVDGLVRFREKLPEFGRGAATTLRLLDEAGSPATVASAGGRYFGFVTGGTLPSALACGWLAAAWNQNAGLPVMSPVASELGRVVTGWLVDLLGLPTGCAAAFVTGATMANVTALAAARDHLLAQSGWDAQADGLFGAPQVTVIVGEKAHAAVYKALGLLGMGRRRVHVVPADGHGRMRPNALPKKVDGPTIACTQAGEVNTGSFDSLTEICEWARSRNVWVHVDGAFGLWALADPSRADLTAGITDADSWATDAHKWLNVGYDSGIALVRRPLDLYQSFASSAGYLPPVEEHEAMHHGPETSQRARQVEIWAALRSLGRDGVRDLVERSCLYARTLAAGLTDAGLTVLNDVVLNQVLVRADSELATRTLLESVQLDGTCWCGPTFWNDQPAMRISVCSWATTVSDINESLAAIIRAAKGTPAGTRKDL